MLESNLECLADIKERIHKIKTIWNAFKEKKQYCSQLIDNSGLQSQSDQLFKEIQEPIDLIVNKSRPDELSLKSLSALKDNIKNSLKPNSDACVQTENKNKSKKETSKTEAVAEPSIPLWMLHYHFMMLMNSHKYIQ
jgi:hypothetical protein